MLDVVKGLLAPYPTLELTVSALVGILAIYFVYRAEQTRRKIEKDPQVSEALHYQGEFHQVVTLQNIERRLSVIEHEMIIMRANDEARAAVIAARWSDVFRLLREIRQHTEHPRT